MTCRQLLAKLSQELLEILWRIVLISLIFFLVIPLFAPLSSPNKKKMRLHIFEVGGKGSTSENVGLILSRRFEA